MATCVGVVGLPVAAADGDPNWWYGEVKRRTPVAAIVCATISIAPIVRAIVSIAIRAIVPIGAIISITPIVGAIIAVATPVGITIVVPVISPPASFGWGR
jgi:hypothetical protein